MAHQEQPYLERLETEQFWHLLLAACGAIADRAKRWPLSEEDGANVRSARHWVTRVHPAVDRVSTYNRQHPEARAVWLNNQMKHTIMLITKVENIIRRHQKEHGVRSFYPSPHALLSLTSRLRSLFSCYRRPLKTLGRTGAIPSISSSNSTSFVDTSTVLFTMRRMRRGGLREGSLRRPSMGGLHRRRGRRWKVR